MLISFEVPDTVAHQFNQIVPPAKQQAFFLTTMQQRIDGLADVFDFAPSKSVSSVSENDKAFYQMYQDRFSKDESIADQQVFELAQSLRQGRQF